MKKEILYQFIDYVLLNSCAVSSPGFYNGKAGMSLCLFEAARYLEDEKLEEHAFELIRESIVLSERAGDCSFESGMAGVGFVLFYLIENRFIEGDFEELFGKQMQGILSETKKMPFLGPHLSLLYFLFSVNKRKENEEIDLIGNKILSDTEATIENQLLYIEDINSGINKLTFLNLLSKYLKIICFTKEYSRSLAIIEKYFGLNEKGRITGNYGIGSYLKEIGTNLNNDCLQQMAMTHQAAFLDNVHSCAITLSERIELLFLLTGESRSEVYSHTISYLEKDLFGVASNQIEKNILQIIPSYAFIPGYESGVSRFLLYCFYRGYRKNEVDCFRFNCLF